MEDIKKTNRQLQAEETKKRIFEAALSLLDEKDFDDIKIIDIVKKAEVSVGSFYNYFESKLDVYDQTYSIADEYFEEVVAPMLSSPLAVDRIKIFFYQYAHYSSTVTSLKLTKILYNSSNTYFTRNNLNGMFGVLTATVDYGIERGEIVSGEAPEEIANFLFIAARGLVYNWCTLNGAYNLPDTMKIGRAHV